MDTLWIILGVLGGLVLLIALLLLLGKATFRIAVAADKVRVYLSLFGIRLWILPLNKGLIKNGEESKLLQKMKAKHQENKAIKKAKLDAGEPVPNLMEDLQMIFAILKFAHGRLKNKLKLRVRRFRIEIATPDAAQTAILYGAVVGVTSCLWEWIQKHVAEVQRRPGEMTVTPNYLKTQTSAEIDITFKLNALKALFLTFEMIDDFKLEMRKANAKAAKRQEEDLIYDTLAK